MISESFAILVIFFLLIISFLRSKYADLTIIVLPVIVIPLTYLATRGLLYAVKGKVFGIRPEIILAFTSLLAIALTCAFMVYISRHLATKKQKLTYIGTIGLYSILLGWAYIFNSIGPILLQIEV